MYACMYVYVLYGHVQLYEYDYLIWCTCTVDLKTIVLPIHIKRPKLMHLYRVSCLVSRTIGTAGYVIALTWQVSWPLSCPQWECRTCQR
jgi:hypothetical protein